MRATCRDCGRSSSWSEAFSTVYSFRGPQSLCPRCRELKNQRQASRMWWLILAVLLVVPLLAAAGVTHDILWMALGAASFLMAAYLSVMPHEIGHAVMARLVGYRPLAIIWGGSNTLFDWKIFGVRVLIGRSPEGGVTYFEPIGERFARLKHAAVTLAGVAVNALLAWLAYAAAQSIDQPFYESALKAALLVIFAANVLLVVVNLWPAPVNSVAGRIPNDGLKLLTLLWGKPLVLAQSRALACMVRIHFAYAENRQEQVLAEAAAAEGHTGPAPWIQVARSAALCQLGRPAEARAMLERALEVAQIDTGSRALAENNIAWALFTMDDPAHDAEALERSARAMDLAPWFAPLTLTRCCVLASRGERGSARLDEARQLLSRVEELEMNAQSHMARAIALGLIASAEGDRAAARTQLQRARQLGDPGMSGRVLQARIPSG